MWHRERMDISVFDCSKEREFLSFHLKVRFLIDEERPMQIRAKIDHCRTYK